MDQAFNYEKAFSRNIGWVTEAEQAVLRTKRVAIGGAGAVGSFYANTFARLGFGKFVIADFDTYDIVNFNRQLGATMSTLGQPKSEVIRRMILDINPEADIRVFPEGVTTDNLNEFLRDVDFYVDGLDFFAFDARQQTFAKCAELGIPSTTCAPLGMGGASLTFLPGQTTFEQYFQWGDLPELDKAIRFIVGLAPAGLHRGYLVVPSAMNLKERRGPSTIMACNLCAGISATVALKVMLGRGKVLAAPHGLHFDAYRNKLVHTYRPGGSSNPLQRLAIGVGKRMYGKMLAKG